MSYKNYQANARKKNKNSTYSDKKGRDFTQSKGMTNEQEELLIEWNHFFRNNVQYFCEWMLGVKLHEYQRFWLYVMQNSTRFMGLASRGTAKSWIVGLFSIARAILYPGTHIILASRTKKQSGLIVTEKIKWFSDNYPAIKKEIHRLVTNANDYVVEFKNGSKVTSVVSSDNSRGYRCNILIVDESRQVSNEVLDSVLKQFLEVRNPPFTMEKNEYDGYLEQPIYIQITSVGYKGEEWDIRANKLLKKVAEGSKTNRVLFFDYLLTMKHNIKTREQIIEDKADMDDVFFTMEMGNLPYGGARKGYYQYSMFKRTIKRAWLPIRFDPANPSAKNKYHIPRAVGERRLVSVDCASASGTVNDLTSISCFRMIPTKKGYKTSLVYNEVFNGMNTELQALRIKQIYTEFTGARLSNGEFLFDGDDTLVLDIANIGRSIYDSMTGVSTDAERDIDYPPLKVMMHHSIPDARYKDLNERAISNDAFECIYPIHGGAAINSDIASSFRSRLKSGLLNFLVDKNEQEDVYIRRKNKDMFSHDDITLKSYVLSPNMNTSLMINESISLEMSRTGDEKIKLQERAGQRKDRYSSVSYGNYVVGIFENELLKDDSSDDLDTLLGAFYIT